MQSYYQTILLNSLQTYKEDEENQINYFATNIDPISEVEEETRFTELNECQASLPHTHCLRSCCTLSDTDQVSEQYQHVPLYKNKKHIRRMGLCLPFIMANKCLTLLVIMIAVLLCLVVHFTLAAIWPCGY